MSVENPQNFCGMTTDVDENSGKTNISCETCPHTKTMKTMRVPTSFVELYNAEICPNNLPKKPTNTHKKS